MPFNGLNHPEQDQGLQFWQTKSFAIITHNLVPGDCIYRVVSEKRDRAMFERLATPRPAPKVTLRSNWLVQQQQQPIRSEGVHSTSKETAKWESRAATRDGTRDATGVDMASGNKLVDVHLNFKVQEVAQNALGHEEANSQEINRVKKWVKQDFYSQRRCKRSDDIQ